MCLWIYLICFITSYGNVYKIRDVYNNISWMLPWYIYIYKTLFYAHEYWYFLIPICIIYRKFNFQYPISEPGEDNTVYSFALSCWLDFLWMNGCKFAWFEFYAAGLHFDTQGISDFCRITKGFLLNLDCHWISYSGSCWYSIYTLECCYNLHPIFIIDNI